MGKKKNTNMYFKVAKSRPHILKPIKNIKINKGYIYRKNLTVTCAEKSDTSVNFNDAVKYASDKWSKVENKTSVALYGGGAIVILWLTSTLIGAVNNIPLSKVIGASR